jgi:hypothetical protein
MNLDPLGIYLELNTHEIFYRIKNIEHCMSNFLIESESVIGGTDIRLDARDIRSITAIAKNCCNNVNLINEDCLLEIIILYYYIMDILHEDYNTHNLENYFGIRNFTSILIKNISFFSKPYVESNLRRKL